MFSVFKNLPTAPTLRSSGDIILLKALLLGVASWMIAVLLLPLLLLLQKSIEDQSGNWVGWSNFTKFFATPSLTQTLVNSLSVAAVATLLSVGMALAFAYGVARTALKAKALYKSIALLPFLVPSLYPGISFVYLFGEQGVFKSLLLGHSIYGPIGIVMGEVFYTFPHAFLILLAALSVSDARLYEAAQSLGSSRIRLFFTITLPEIRFGLISAIFVVFTLVLVDFGIPKVIGGQYDVLATEIYKQVIGQQNFQMGALVSVLLLIPASIAFMINERARRKQLATVSGQSVSLVPKPSALVDINMQIYCSIIVLAIIVIIGMAIYASFVSFWPYNLSLSLQHYRFEVADSNGWQSFFNSLKLAVLTALFGTVFIFLTAYIVEKVEIGRTLSNVMQGLCLLPMAIPGIVLGFSYIFYFNNPQNPLNFLYGTMGILVLSTIMHFYTVGHLTATVALKQLDKGFEAVASSLKVPRYRTFLDVTVPLCWPVIVEIGIYLFVNAMTTLSAVVFLYGPKTMLASVAAINMDDSGDIAPAAAMCTMIFVTNCLVRGLILVIRPWSLLKVTEKVTREVV